MIRTDHVVITVMQRWYGVMVTSSLPGITLSLHAGFRNTTGLQGRNGVDCIVMWMAFTQEDVVYRERWGDREGGGRSGDRHRERTEGIERKKE